MSIEQKTRDVFQKILDVNPAEIKIDQPLDKCLGVDSTEMVEISVGLKKSFNIELANNEIKKSHSFNDIVALLKAKGAN